MKRITVIVDVGLESSTALVEAIKLMPPLSQPEAVKWLMERPELPAWLWDQVGNLMSFSPTTQTWTGAPEVVLHGEPIVSLAAFNTPSRWTDLCKNVQTEARCSKSTAETLIRLAITQNVIRKNRNRFYVLTISNEPFEPFIPRPMEVAVDLKAFDRPAPYKYLLECVMKELDCNKTVAHQKIKNAERQGLLNRTLHVYSRNPDYKPAVNPAVTA